MKTNTRSKKRLKPAVVRKLSKHKMSKHGGGKMKSSQHMRTMRRLLRGGHSFSEAHIAAVKMDRKTKTKKKKKKKMKGSGASMANPIDMTRSKY